MALDSNRNVRFLFESLGGKINFSLAQVGELRGVKAKSYIRKDHPLDLHNLGYFFNDNFFDGNLNQPDDFFRWLWCRRHFCRRWRLLQWDSGGYSIIRVRPRVGDNRRVGLVTEKSLGRCTAANKKMEGSKNRPLQNESGR